MAIAVGTLEDGKVVISARTRKGSGYTRYPTLYEAYDAFDEIVAKAGLRKVES